MADFGSRGDYRWVVLSYLQTWKVWPWSASAIVMNSSPSTVITVPTVNESLTLSPLPTIPCDNLPLQFKLYFTSRVHLFCNVTSAETFSIPCLGLRFRPAAMLVAEIANKVSRVKTANWCKYFIGLALGDVCKMSTLNKATKSAPDCSIFFSTCLPNGFSVRH